MTTLKEISTRELLAEWRSRRVWRQDGIHAGDKEGFEKRQNVAFRLAKGGECSVACATDDELKAEIATRPHIPSRAEGKLLRRLMAQTGWTEEQLRAHPKFGEQLADIQHPNRRKISPAHAAILAPRYGKGFGNAFKVVK